MDLLHGSDDHRQDHEHTHDPLRKAFKETPSFNRLWLTDERPLTVVQAFGFSLISAALLIAALFSFRVAILEIRSPDTALVMALFSAGMSAATFYLSLRGAYRIAKDLFRS